MSDSDNAAGDSKARPISKLKNAYMAPIEECPDTGKTEVDHSSEFLGPRGDNCNELHINPDDPLFTATKCNEDEKKIIMELKNLCLETIKIEMELQRKIFKAEKQLEAQNMAVYDRRLKLIKDFRSKHQEQGDDNIGGLIRNFWLNVLKASYSDLINGNDEDLLKHLIDIRVNLHCKPEMSFVISFLFEPNKYFTNEILTKTYFMNNCPDMNNPLSYDGSEIYKTEGCVINWKPPYDKKEEGASSFFDFFNPPVVPNDTTALNYARIKAKLQSDYEVGFYLKERVIPKAVLFFTGEIIDCQYALEDDSNEETDDEDDDDDVEDYEEEDESESSSAEDILETLGKCSAVKNFKGFSFDPVNEYGKNAPSSGTAGAAGGQHSLSFLDGIGDNGANPATSPKSSKTGSGKRVVASKDALAAAYASLMKEKSSKLSPRHTLTTETKLPKKDGSKKTQGIECRKPKSPTEHKKLSTVPGNKSPKSEKKVTRKGDTPTK